MLEVDDKLISAWLEQVRAGDWPEISRGKMIELLRLALRATDPELVLVPREPTRAMRKAGAGPWMVGDKQEEARACYQAMIAAVQEDQP